MKVSIAMSLAVLLGTWSIGFAKESGLATPELEAEDAKADAILGPMELREPTLYTGFPTVTKRFLWQRDQAERVNELCKGWRKLKERELEAQSFSPLFSECRLRHREGTTEFYYEAYIVFQQRVSYGASGPKNDRFMVAGPSNEKPALNR